MDVSDVLRDRMRTPAGIERMITVSTAAHALLIGGLLFAPHGLFNNRATPRRSSMTITLGAGSAGPAVGGLTALGGRPVQVQTPPDDPPKREALRPPAAKAPEMTVPVKNAKPVKAAAPPAIVKQAPDEARGRTPTRGERVSEGSAVAETRARGQGFGLASGGGSGTGATLDVGDFCCPDYIVQMSERIRSNWDNHADASVLVGLHFVIERDGRLTQVAVERSSGNPLLDLAARRAVEITRQLAPLPPSYPNPNLGVHLNFQYER
jgi:protein TonB